MTATPSFADSDDAEELLGSLLAPGERVVWLSRPDRALWRRVVATGLGCLPFVALILAVTVGTAAAGAATASGALTGHVEATRALAALLGMILLGIMVYPIAADEIARRERRYVVTTRRALVLVPGRVEGELPLLEVTASALHSGLFDDKPSGVELRRADGSAGIVFRDMDDPEATRAEVELALAAARADETPVTS
jgi:hypothetical protein